MPKAGNLRLSPMMAAVLQGVPDRWTTMQWEPQQALKAIGGLERRGLVELRAWNGRPQWRRTPSPTPSKKP